MEQRDMKLARHIYDQVMRVLNESPPTRNLGKGLKDHEINDWLEVQLNEFKT